MFEPCVDSLGAPISEEALLLLFLKYSVRGTRNEIDLRCKPSVVVLVLLLQDDQYNQPWADTLCVAHCEGGRSGDSSCGTRSSLAVFAPGRSYL